MDFEEVTPLGQNYLKLSAEGMYPKALPLFSLQGKKSKRFK
jgi:hypothetical protein